MRLKVELPLEVSWNNRNGSNADNGVHASIILVVISVAVVAEVSLRPPRKLFIFITKKYVYRVKLSKK